MSHFYHINIILKTSGQNQARKEKVLSASGGYAFDPGSPPTTQVISSKVRYDYRKPQVSSRQQHARPDGSQNLHYSSTRHRLFRHVNVGRNKFSKGKSEDNSAGKKPEKYKKGKPTSFKTVFKRKSLGSANFNRSGKTTEAFPGTSIIKCQKSKLQGTERAAPKPSAVGKSTAGPGDATTMKPSPPGEFKAKSTRMIRIGSEMVSVISHSFYTTERLFLFPDQITQ